MCLIQFQMHKTTTFLNAICWLRCFGGICVAAREILPCCELHKEVSFGITDRRVWVTSCQARHNIIEKCTLRLEFCICLFCIFPLPSPLPLHRGLAVISPADKPQVGHASRRTRLHADTPPVLQIGPLS